MNRVLLILAAACLLLSAAGAGAQEIPKSGFTGVVLHPEDGDTLMIREEGKRRAVRIRLIGVDAPVKATRKEEGQEPWGTEAQQWMTLQITQKTVRVEYDVVTNETGQKTYWGYVWFGDRLMNEELLRTGNAFLDTRPPNVRYVERLQAAQKEAREKGLGIWDPKRPLEQMPAAFATAQSGAKADEKEKMAELTVPGWKEGCVIGNEGTRIYHLPGSGGYERAKGSKHAVFFADEAAAQKAGYVPASR